MKRLAATLLILLSFVLVHAQDDVPELIGDRPDMTESASVIPKKYVQLESGLEYTYYSDIENEFTNNQTLIRWGFLQNAELRFGFAINQLSSGISSYTYMPIYVGTKIHLTDKQGAIPQMALVFGMEGIKLNNKLEFVPGVICALEYDLAKHISLGMNIGAEYSTSEKKPTGRLSASFGFEMSKRTGCFLEGAWFPSTNNNDARFNVGYTYLLSKRVQADAFAGFGLLIDSPIFNLGAGVIFIL